MRRSCALPVCAALFLPSLTSKTGVDPRPLAAKSVQVRSAPRPCADSPTGRIPSNRESHPDHSSPGARPEQPAHSRAPRWLIGLGRRCVWLCAQRRARCGPLNIAAYACPLGPCLLTPYALGIMCPVMCRSQVEERRRSTCSPGRRAEEAEEPKTGTGAREARPISLVGVRSRYPVAGRPTDILLGFR